MVAEPLRASSLHAYYGESHVLHGVDCHVSRGEVVTLLGRNGAGRTTTLKTLLGLIVESINLGLVADLFDQPVEELRQPPGRFGKIAAPRSSTSAAGRAFRVPTAPGTPACASRQTRRDAKLWTPERRHA